MPDHKVMTSAVGYGYTSAHVIPTFTQPAHINTHTP